MDNIAFVFPGQGSQSVGMGKDWFENTEFGKSLFEQADDLLGRPLSRICFEGPEEDLRMTGNQQPALYVCSAAALAGLFERGIQPTIVAGHSLGEYSALFASGAFDFKTGLKLVQTRGNLMNDAAERQPGAMAAIIGLDIEPLRELCESAEGICRIANINSPGQIVISGEKEAVEKVSEEAKAAGAKRALMLPVHGAFHSPLMQAAAEEMAKTLEAEQIDLPRIPCLSNVTADSHSSPEGIQELLARQITSPVRWVEIMERILQLNPKVVVEVGPGKVLTGMFKRMKATMPLLNCEKPADLDMIVDKLQ